MGIVIYKIVSACLVIVSLSSYGLWHLNYSHSIKWDRIILYSMDATSQFSRDSSTSWWNKSGDGTLRHYTCVGKTSETLDTTWSSTLRLQGSYSSLFCKAAWPEQMATELKPFYHCCIKLSVEDNCVMWGHWAGNYSSTRKTTVAWTSTCSPQWYWEDEEPSIRLLSYGGQVWMLTLNR